MRKKRVMSKKEYFQRYYLFVGIIIGASFSWIASFTTGWYFYSLEHPEYQIYTLIYIIVFLLLLLMIGYAVHKIEVKI